MNSIPHVHLGFLEGGDSTIAFALAGSILGIGVWSSISGRLVLSALWFYLARSVSVPPSDATAPAGPVSTFASPSPPLLKFPVPALDIVLFTTKLTLYHDDHEDQNMDFLQKWGFNSVE